MSALLGNHLSLSNDLMNSPTNGQNTLNNRDAFENIVKHRSNHENELQGNEYRRLKCKKQQVIKKIPYGNVTDYDTKYWEVVR